MTKKKYKLLPEHEARFPEWRGRWIANAMSTAPMTDEDRRICVEAVHGMYAAAGRESPRVVFVPSPFVAAFAGGFAAAIWYRRKTRAATRDATRAATWDATRPATRPATGDATRDDLSKWYVVPGDMRALAAEIGVGDFGLRCAAQAWRMWQGGNQWAGYDAFLSFFQDVAGLTLDYSAYRHWRALAEHSGPRIVHDEFCIISDRPRVLRVDDQSRPHCEDGPFCRWSDGSALYSWRGVRVPAKWIMDEKPTAREALTWPNIEERRAACEIVGWANVLDQLDAQVIDEDGDPQIGTLLRVTLPDVGTKQFLRVTCGTGRTFALPVPPDMETAIQANAWTYGLDAADFKLEVRT